MHTRRVETEDAAHFPKAFSEDSCPLGLCSATAAGTTRASSPPIGCAACDLQISEQTRRRAHTSQSNMLCGGALPTILCWACVGLPSGADQRHRDLAALPTSGQAPTTPASVSLPSPSSKKLSPYTVLWIMQITFSKQLNIEI